MKSLREYQDGKLVVHAWLSRGLVSVSDLAAWKFSGDESKVQHWMQRTPFALDELLSLEDLPAVGDSDENKALAAVAAQGPLEGERVAHWCIETSGTPTPLPSWFKIPVDRTVAIWKRERDEWSLKKEKRFKNNGTYELTKAAEEKYQVGCSDQGVPKFNECSDFYGSASTCIYNYLYIYVIYIYIQ